jgi:hypothetical protein
VLAPDPRLTVATATVPVALLGGTDGRASFRRRFCAALEREGVGAAAPADCDAMLVRLPDEPPDEPPEGPADARPTPTSRPADPTLRVLFVPGLASDCAGQAALIDGELRATVERLGHAFRVLPVSGLSSDAANARRLRDATLAATPGAERAVILTHSKGTVDVLRMLVDHPGTQARIAAVVSLAGAVGGSPLARIASDDALAVAAWSPGHDCDAGDLGALASLVPEHRQRWLAEHRLPAGIRYYSLVALPDPGRISPGLRPGHRLLSAIDPRNDGNVLFTDQVIPGATLLGYLNADHWAIATDLGASPNPLVRAVAGAYPFPRRAMVEAVLRTVEDDLRRSGRSALPSRASRRRALELPPGRLYLRHEHRGRPGFDVGSEAFQCMPRTLVPS